MPENKKSYPEGHFVSKWMGIGMLIFAGLGVPISVITNQKDLIGMGPVLGMLTGIVIGALIEEKHKKEGLIVPDSKNGSLKRMTAIAIVLFGLAIAVVISIIV